MASALRGSRRLTYVIAPAPERNALLGSRLGTSVRSSSSMTRMSMPSSFYIVIDFNFVQYLSLHDFELASVLILASHRPQATKSNHLDAYAYFTTASGQQSYSSQLVFPTDSQPNAICNPSAFLLTSLSVCLHLLVTGAIPDLPRVAALSPCS